MLPYESALASLMRAEKEKSSANGAKRESKVGGWGDLAKQLQTSDAMRKKGKGASRGV